MMLGGSCSACCGPCSLAICSPWDARCDTSPSSVSFSVFADAVNENPWIDPYPGQASINRDQHDAVYVFDFADLPDVVGLNEPGYLERDVSSEGVEAFWQVTTGCTFTDILLRVGISSPMTDPPNIYATDNLGAECRLTISCSGYMEMRLSSGWGGIGYGNFGDFVTANQMFLRRWTTSGGQSATTSCLDPKSGAFSEVTSSSGWWPAVAYGDIYDYPNIGFYSSSDLYLGPARRVTKFMTLDGTVS